MAKKEVKDQKEIEKKNGKSSQKETMIGKKSKKTSSKKLEKELEEVKVEHAELKDKYLRLFAEFENFRKRTFKENLELRKTAAQDVVYTLLPVLDDFDRAKKSNDDDNSSEEWSDGVTMVYNRLQTALSTKGLKPMESDGAVFDPELHEAITEIPAPNDELKGKIIDTIEKGYLLNDKIIRHAKVVVGK